MELNNLSYTKGSRGHKRRTYGRGFSSGLGKTSGRGQKGQHSRKSGNVRIGFEGGQTPIYRKIPKVGFNKYNFCEEFYVVSLDQVMNLKLKNVNRKTLLEKGVIGKKKLPIKLIGPRDYKKVNIEGITFEVDIVTKPVEKFIIDNKGNLKITKE